MLILLGIIILIISFAIALVSMIKEQKRIFHNNSSEQEAKGPEASELESEVSSSPDAKPLDHLKSRIEELEAREVKSGKISDPQQVIEPVVPEPSEHRFSSGPGSGIIGIIKVADLVREKNKSRAG